MSARLNTKKVWKAMQADPVVATQIPEAAQGAMRELIEGLAEPLAPHLDKKVALASLMEAKLAATEHMLATGFPAKMAAALPKEMLPVSVGEMAEMMAEALKQFRSPLMEMIHNAQAYLAQMGLTERQLMAHPRGVGLNATSLASYDAGTLTIRGLLETQPAVVLLNNAE